jgi:hypothetical protein
MQGQLEVVTKRYFYFTRESLLAMLQPQNVLKVYNGKRGCMCGCNGNYKVTLACLEEASNDRGYAYDAEEDVSDRAVAMACTRMRNYITARSDEELQAAINKKELSISPDAQYVCVDTDTRTNAVYFNAAAQKIFTQYS